MATFPRLKTGAVAQYPLLRQEQFRNQTVRFVDGTDQRYRDSGAVRQRWDIQCSGLDEGEAAAIEEFFMENQGAYGSFAFTDPWDGNVYDDCSLELDSLGVTMVAEMRGMARFAVVRNR
jgi:phage-related protein